MDGIQIEHMAALLDSNRARQNKELAAYLSANIKDVAHALKTRGFIDITVSNGCIVHLTREALLEALKPKLSFWERVRSWWPHF